MSYWPWSAVCYDTLPDLIAVRGSKEYDDNYNDYMTCQTGSTNIVFFIIIFIFLIYLNSTVASRPLNESYKIIAVFGVCTYALYRLSLYGSSIAFYNASRDIGAQLSGSTTLCFTESGAADTDILSDGYVLNSHNPRKGEKKPCVPRSDYTNDQYTKAKSEVVTRIHDRENANRIASSRSRYYNNNSLFTVDFS
jgi:hypothetical protein